MSSIAIHRAAPAAPNNNGLATAQVFALLSNAALPCTVAAPGKLALEGKKFAVHAEGNFVAAAGATTFKAQFLAALVTPASPLVVANWTTLATGTAAAGAALVLGASWYLHADLIFDSTSGYLGGIASGLVNNTLTAAAALAAQISGINGTNQNVTQNAVVIPPADPVIVFAVAGTFSAAGANVGNLMNFEVSF